MLTVTRYENLPVDHPCAGCDIRMRTFCSVLDAAELEKFRCQGATARIETGRPLFHQGDPADVIFNLKKGSLRLYKLLADGRRQVTGFLFPGAVLGLAVNDEHAFSAEAIEPVEVCRYSRYRFDTFVDEHPRMERELYRIAAHELALAREQMVLLGRKTAAERLATFLLGLLRRERDHEPGADLISLPMNRLDIADYLGLTKETVSRVFTSFKTTGLIRLLNDDQVLVLDCARLAQVASGERADV
jgi:CRP/FNR family transcriptional regulator